MGEPPLVSVIMIFLNAGRFLEEAVASVFAQVYENWELLLVDDGSTDDGSDLAKRLAEQHPERIRYLQHPGGVNRGMSASRNLGLSHARGPLVALLDADDVWLPGKLSRQVEILLSHPEAGMTYDATRYWYSWPGGPVTSPERPDRLRRLGFPPGTLVPPPDLVPLFLRGEAETPGTCSVLMRRDASLQVGGFVESFRGMYEDQAFFFKFCLEYPVYLDGGHSALYRQHPESACSVASRSGLYTPRARSNPSEERFLDWLSVYVTGRCESRRGPAMGLPGSLRARLRRRSRAAGQGSSSSWARLLWKIDLVGRTQRVVNLVNGRGHQS